jgi:hypothetical protein
MLSYSFNVEARRLKKEDESSLSKNPVWPRRFEVISQENAAFISTIFAPATSLISW